MDLATHVAEFLAQRAGAGSFVDQPTAERCAVDAARYFNGWATITSAPGAASEAITAATVVTPSEFAVMKPLFVLLVELESSIMAESSRVMGVDAVGRSVSEVKQDITQAQLQLQKEAFDEPVFLVGLPV